MRTHIILGAAALVACCIGRIAYGQTSVQLLRDNDGRSQDSSPFMITNDRTNGFLNDGTPVVNDPSASNLAILGGGGVDDDADGDFDAGATSSVADNASSSAPNLYVVGSGTVSASDFDGITGAVASAWAGGGSYAWGLFTVQPDPMNPCATTGTLHATIDFEGLVSGIGADAAAVDVQFVIGGTNIRANYIGGNVWNVVGTLQQGACGPVMLNDFVGGGLYTAFQDVNVNDQINAQVILAVTAIANAPDEGTASIAWEIVGGMEFHVTVP